MHQVRDTNTQEQADTQEPGNKQEPNKPEHKEQESAKEDAAVLGQFGLLAADLGAVGFLLLFQETEEELLTNPALPGKRDEAPGMSGNDFCAFGNGNGN